MAEEPMLTIRGNLTDDPELSYTPSGAAAATFTVAQTPRHFDRQAGEWKDGETLFMRCKAWRDLAEHISRSFHKGTRVIVEGRLTYRTYEKDGERRSVTELQVEDAGPSVKFATATVQRRNYTEPTDDDAAAALSGAEPPAPAGP